MQPGEEASSMTEDENAGGGGAVEEPLLIDGFPVDEQMLPRPEDLSEDLREMAEIIGVRQVMRLALRFPGVRVCFPAFRHYRARLRHERIRADYDTGMSVKQIAQKHDLSERHIWAILGS